MARPKRASIELGSLQDCVGAMADLLKVTLQLERLVADRDLKVAALQKEFEKPLDGLRAEKADMESSLQAFYMAHLAEIEKGGRKSLQLPNGVMGRKLSPPKLCLLNRSWTWAAVLTKLRVAFGDRFLRQSEPEIDKELVKAELPREEMAEHGLKLTQDETFYAEPARLPDGGE